MLEAMQASKVCAPAFIASFSTSTCTCGEIVAQLMKSLSCAFTSKLSPLPPKISRIALSSETTVMMTSDSAVTCDKSWRSEEHTSELQSLRHLVCRLLLDK